MSEFQKPRVRPDTAEAGQDAAPLFGSWRNAYLAVVVIFLIEVGFFYFVSRFFL